MAQKSKESGNTGQLSHKNHIYPISTEGNQVEIDYIGKGEFRLICRDHFSQNFVDYYVHRNDLVGLMEFIRKYLENN